MADRDSTLEVVQGRNLIDESRRAIARLRTSLEETRERLAASHRHLQSSRLRRREATTLLSPGVLGQRVVALADSVEELHYRLSVDISTTASELQDLLGVTDDLQGVADFCAMLEPDTLPGPR